jgi:hypothetical protein
MYTPIPKESKFKNKKHFLQKHPVIGRFFESFGCLAWPIIILLVTGIVMYIVPDWRPTLLIILATLSHKWNYFWGEVLPQFLRWDWSKPVK